MLPSQMIIKTLKEKVGEDIKLLFMPYKRDMWDSLESVYKEAKKQGLKADIFPLPYTFRTADYKFTEFIKDDFTDCGEILDELPENNAYDVILYHNAYDMCNLVTSVLPDFYTDKLKDMARCICLVPYGIGNKCDLYPGILNADFCFLENAEVKEDILLKAQEAGLTGDLLERFAKKFIVTGSTKCELDLKQEIPAEWTKRIKDKKVVLFATSLVPLINNPAGEFEKYIRALKHLTNDDKQIVIWREHPLTLATIRSMMPQYEEYYRIIKNEFSDKIIIDDTKDYRIAFSIADVLYSVPSSLVEVWKTTGKELHVL